MTKSDAAISSALRRIRRHICTNMGQSTDAGKDYSIQGILDPITVVVNSVRSAVSVAQQFARIEVAVLVEDSD
jgi:chaperonin GroEL (HSP60 family)